MHVTYPKVSNLWAVIIFTYPQCTIAWIITGNEAPAGKVCPPIYTDWDCHCHTPRLQIDPKHQILWQASSNRLVTLNSRVWRVLNTWLLWNIPCLWPRIIPFLLPWTVQKSSLKFQPNSRLWVPLCSHLNSLPQIHMEAYVAGPVTITLWLHHPLPWETSW